MPILLPTVQSWAIYLMSLNPFLSDVKMGIILGASRDCSENSGAIQ